MTNDDRAENLARFLIGNDLREAFCIYTRLRFTKRLKWKHPLHCLVSLLLRRFQRHSNSGNLRRSEDDSRHGFKQP